MSELRKVVLLFLGVFICQIVWANGPIWAERQVLVKVSDNETIEFPTVEKGRIVGSNSLPGFHDLIGKYGVTEVGRAFKTSSHQLDRIFKIDFSQSDLVLPLLQELQNYDFVEYAERVPVYQLQHTPDDLDVRQWHLYKIEAEAAWDYHQGTQDVIVAIVDDAVRIDHEDLSPRIWTNPGEIFGDSIDNDGNGYIDDLNGYDVADQDWDVMPPSGGSTFSFGHGTHVAGIAAAATNNGKGIASIGYNVTIMPVKTKHDTTIGTPNLDATIYGVDYAIVSGADVINMSFGGSGFSFSYQILFNEAHARGIINVAAAGNDGEYRLLYPAGYTHVINVGSTRGSDVKSGFSNWHPYLDVMAPGSGIFSTGAGDIDTYVKMSGTSMSTPLTAGLCALVVSMDTSLSPDQVLNCLKLGADNIDGLNPDHVGMIGAGRINARKTLECILFPIAVEEEVEAEGNLSIFPNPVSDRINFNAKFTESNELRIAVSDMMGRELAVPFTGFVNSGQFSFSWEKGQTLTSGAYFVTWEFGGARTTEKILVR